MEKEYTILAALDKKLIGYRLTIFTGQSLTTKFCILSIYSWHFLKTVTKLTLVDFGKIQRLVCIWLFHPNLGPKIKMFSFSDIFLDIIFSMLLFQSRFIFPRWNLVQWNKIIWDLSQKYVVFSVNQFFLILKTKLLYFV